MCTPPAHKLPISMVADGMYAPATHRECAGRVEWDPVEVSAPARVACAPISPSTGRQGLQEGLQLLEAKKALGWMNPSELKRWLQRRHQELANGMRDVV